MPIQNIRLLPDDELGGEKTMMNHAIRNLSTLEQEKIGGGHSKVDATVTPGATASCDPTWLERVLASLAIGLPITGAFLVFDMCRNRYRRFVDELPVQP